MRFARGGVFLLLSALLAQRKTNQLYYLFLCLLLLCVATAGAQGLKPVSPSPVADSLKKTQLDSTGMAKPDTTIALGDSLTSDSGLEDEVIYEAQDSIRMDIAKKEVHLFGKAKVVYGEINLTAGYIVINWEKNLVTAVGLPDSSGRMADYPVFKEAGKDEILSKQIVYNIKTKKAKIKDVVTKSGEGYLLGKDVKMMNSEELFMRGMKYTTCDDNEHPHFYLNLTRAKVIPNKTIIAGPSYMVIEDVPLPIALPFGYFPVMKTRKAGIIFPEYGESPQLGFFLRNGGYYIPINDYLDLRIVGDLYTKGSWRLNPSLNYNQRYKFNGNFNLSFSNTVIGEREDPNYSKTLDFRITWTHNQDPKASPNGRFSASVDLGTATAILNNSFASNNFLRNSLNSSVSYTKTFPNKPYNLSVSARHSQNTQTRNVSVTLPDAVFTVQRIEPFKRKSFVGATRWYERVGFNLTTTGRAEINGVDSVLFNDQFTRRINSGINHSIPVNLSLNVLKYFTLTPSVTYNERWYFRSVERRLDGATNAIVRDTVDGFNRVYDYSFSAGLNFRLFGLVQFKKGKIRAIRHVMAPTLSFSYRPDFGDERFGYYRTVVDSSGRQIRYSPFEGTLYGVPGQGRSGLVSLNITNNLELKVKSKSDTITGMKKVKVFDAFDFNTSYNLAADSFQIAPFTLNARTTFGNGFSVVMNATFDPYVMNMQTGIRQKETYLEAGEGIARLSNYNIAFNGSIRSKTQGGNLNSRDIAIRNYDPRRFVDFNVPYSLNFALILGYNAPVREGLPPQLNQTLGLNGDFRITTKWKVTYSASYDMVRGNLSGMQFGIYRDLHCWDMSFNWIPVGFRQSYTFDLRVKSAMLQQLRLSRRRDWYDF